MSRETDVRVVGCTLYFVPVETRVPLKFGSETLTWVTCARVRLRVRDGNGRECEGWGETPLNVQWVWPSDLPYHVRHGALMDFCGRLAQSWWGFEDTGHPLEIGFDFQSEVLPALCAEFNRASGAGGLLEPMPHLAALVCCSAFDIALHDAYGNLHGLPVYETYRPPWMNRDLPAFLQAAPDSSVHFDGLYPADFLVNPTPRTLRAWHLVGGLDALEESDLTGTEPNDGYPVTLRQWIARDGLTCLKIKLRGTDAEWDYARLKSVGAIGIDTGVEWLSADFNCTVTEAAYVNGILDRLRDEQPRVYGMILYVEQPFPYDLETRRIDAHSVAGRKPLFLDESAHDWKMIRIGRELGWNGVALKTCKTQSGALLSLCWARAHGMSVMVQDLTNPMLAQLPHVLLAAHAGTIMGVETNAMQFYPDASGPEAVVHPGLYRRRSGCIDLSSIRGAGFGYRLDEIDRVLPPPAQDFFE